MTPISVMERKKEKKCISETAAEWLMLPDKRNLTHHSIFILLWWEKKSWKNISSPPPPRPAASPMASIHRETVQATVMASCASWGRRSFFCFNGQLGKASEVTLEKCMHQRKKLWRGVGGAVLESLCALCLKKIFFPSKCSSKFPLT